MDVKVLRISIYVGAPIAAFPRAKVSMYLYDTIVWDPVENKQVQLVSAVNFVGIPPKLDLRGVLLNWQHHCTARIERTRLTTSLHVSYWTHRIERIRLTSLNASHWTHQINNIITRIILNASYWQHHCTHHIQHIGLATSLNVSYWTHQIENAIARIVLNASDWQRHWTHRIERIGLNASDWQHCWMHRIECIVLTTSLNVKNSKASDWQHHCTHGSHHLPSCDFRKYHCSNWNFSEVLPAGCQSLKLRPIQSENYQEA